MKTLSLVLFLVAGALSAPADDVKPVEDVKEVKGAAEPQARALAAAPFGAAPYMGYQHQFGARLNPYYQPQYQYLSGQQHSYFHGAPAQAYVSGSPYYHHGALGAKHYQGIHGAQYYQGGHYYPEHAYYQGAHFAHPSGVYHTKSVVQPAPVVVKAQAAPAPVKAIVPAPAVVGVHRHEYERFAAPAVVRAHAAPAPAPAHIVKAAQPVPHPAAVEPFHVIVKQAHDDNFDGSFTYSYETDHGIAVDSTGYVKNAGTPDQVQVMQGSYTYISPEGVPIVTTYIADENGFQVQGDHLPVPPAMPEAIAKSIEYQRSLPPSEEDIIEQQRAKVYAQV